MIWLKNEWINIWKWEPIEGKVNHSIPLTKSERVASDFFVAYQHQIEVINSPIVNDLLTEKFQKSFFHLIILIIFALWKN